MQVFLVANPDHTKFLVVGSGNSEYDVDFLTNKRHEATLFSTRKEAEYRYLIKGKRMPVVYYVDDIDPKASRQLGKFMQTCVTLEGKLLLKKDAAK